MDSKKVITVKLLIDTKANKVLFAESSKDFVDFLFYLLSLPIGTVVKLLSGKSMAGSIGNLYNSFANLNETYLQPNLQKSILLNPKLPISISNVPLLMGTSASSAGSSTTSTMIYSCAHCCKTATNKYNTPCPTDSCKYMNKTMIREVQYIAGASNYSSTTSYVQGVISYMISDDLSVTPMSTISCISMMSKCNVTDLSVLQEREVKVGTEKGLELLKASFHSTTVLTDVFLS